MTPSDVSTVAVTFQAIGTLLVGAMIAQFARMFAWRYARDWAVAWGSMFIALASLWGYIATSHRFWWFTFLAGQWTFLFLLFSGCRELTTGKRFQGRMAAFLAPFAALLAVAIVTLSATFNHLFAISAAVVAIVSYASYRQLGKYANPRRTTGWRTIRVVLLLLSIQYALYVPLYTLTAMGRTFYLLPYASLVDLLGAVVLGFSMILLAHEEGQRETSDRITALQTARDHLEQKSRIDPLTEALNRHALHVMPEGSGGAAVMIDIDGLKQINDSVGHLAGDAVIRAAASTIRARVRPDDLLFRWGGDEFLLVMPNATLVTAGERLGPLKEGIRVTLPGGDQWRTVDISWGGAEFGGDVTLDDAIRNADEQMYSKRAARRRLQAEITGGLSSQGRR